MLADSKLLKSDSLTSVRLARCNISCEGVTHLAKALEGVGEEYCNGGHLAINRGSVLPV